MKKFLIILTLILSSINVWALDIDFNQNSENIILSITGKKVLEKEAIGYTSKFNDNESVRLKLTYSGINDDMFLQYVNSFGVDIGYSYGVNSEDKRAVRTLLDSATPHCPVHVEIERTGLNVNHSIEIKSIKASCDIFASANSDIESV